ncbi:hypothetical protein WR25_14064 [Diploscapter pachys]|uniref:Uncharacterized protein n=1 Tax=Diploscapter pachys TaxID=2018661 RepID=A0A2A2J6D8_9BILA|nr:hypothetical protein WR25_14064 [Diploscapter pachys]
MARLVEPIKAPPASFTSPSAGLFSNESLAHCWTSDDTWQNVYSWINTSPTCNESSEESGDSIRSSSSSHHLQISPKPAEISRTTSQAPSCGIWRNSSDENSPSPLFDALDGPIGFFELPTDFTSPFDNHNENKTSKIWNQCDKNNYNSNLSNQENTPQNSTDYDILQEFLKLNISSSAWPLAPTPSTSSPLPWNLPDDSTSAPAPTSSIFSPSTFSNPLSCAHPPSTAPIRSSTTAAPVHKPRYSDPLASLSAGSTANSSWPNFDSAAATSNGVFGQLAAVQQQQQQQQNYVMPRIISQAARLAVLRQRQIEFDQKLDEASEEYRQLEKERKQTEAELARHNLGKKISSSNGLPIPRLPTAPSRVDRLIVDFFREHARISTLLSKMEQLKDATLPLTVHHTLKELLETVTVLQHCRHHERNAILQQLRGEPVRYDEEKESAAICQALIAVRNAAARARAANWCSLVWTLGYENTEQVMQVQKIVDSQFTIPPPPIKPRKLSTESK